MFEEEDDAELEFDPNDVSAEDSLMYSHFSGPRIFILNDNDKFNMFGVLLEESDDSFLVGLPAKMTSEDGEVKVEPFMPVPYSRFMKSAILSVSYTFGIFHELYMNYVETKGAELYPEIADYIEEDAELETESAESTIITPIDADITDISLSSEVEEGTKVLGMTDDELQKYLTDKYNIGELAIGSRKKQ